MGTLPIPATHQGMSNLTVVHQPLKLKGLGSNPSMPTMKKLTKPAMVITVCMFLFLMITKIVHPDIMVVDTQLEISELNVEYYEGKIEDSNGEPIHFLVKKDILEYFSNNDSGYPSSDSCLVTLRWLYPESDYRLYDITCK